MNALIFFVTAILIYFSGLPIWTIVLFIPFNINDNVITVFGSGKAKKNFISVFSLFQISEIKNTVSLFGSFYQNAGRDAWVIFGITAYQNAGRDTWVIFGITAYQNSGEDTEIIVGITGYQNSNNDSEIVVGIAGYQNSGRNAWVGLGITGYQNSNNDSEIVVGIAGYQNSGEISKIDNGIAFYQKSKNAITKFAIAFLKKENKVKKIFNFISLN